MSDSTLRGKLIRLAYTKPELRPKLLPLILKEARATAPKVTIYSRQSTIPGISKIEAVLTGVTNPGGIYYVPKRGRRERMMMTYYAPFILVVPGWGHPDPGSAWEDAQPGSSPGVTVQKSKYRSTDPRYITDFMESVGKRLKPIVLFEDGKLKFDKSGLPPHEG